MTDVRDAGVANALVGDVPVAVTVDPGGDTWAVVLRRLDGRTVELTRDGDQLVEVGGDGRWDAARGLPLAEGETGLDLLPGFTSFPADYVRFFPDGFFWQPSGLLPADR